MSGVPGDGGDMWLDDWMSENPWERRDEDDRAIRDAAIEECARLVESYHLVNIAAMIRALKGPL